MPITKDCRLFLFILLLIGSGVLYEIIYQKSYAPYLSHIFTTVPSQESFNAGLFVTQEKNAFTSKTTTKHITFNKKRLEDILNHEDGIIFLETTDTMQPQPLVLCAIESAARIYQDRPVVFLMKGVRGVELEDDEKPTRYFPTLSSRDNFYIFPLVIDELLKGTPLYSWYNKINPEKEKFWIHIIADSCRLALIWKYGGLYMDTDIISLRPVPHKNFVAGQHSQASSNGIFGFSSKHNFTWTCMESFVHNYNGEVWGFQGPTLFTRVLKQSCDLPDFEDFKDISCGNISFLHPHRFYPIGYGGWTKYYEVWDTFPTFNNSYAVHLWNYMNKEERRSMVPGSNTLVENLYKKHCPSTYEAIKRNETIYL